MVGAEGFELSTPCSQIGGVHLAGVYTIAGYMLAGVGRGGPRMHQVAEHKEMRR